MEIIEKVEKTNINSYPSLLKRIQSGTIDSFLLLVLMLIISLMFDGVESIPGWFRALLFVVIFLVYEPLLMLFGGTIGNRIMGIQVKSKDEILGINLIQAY